MEEYYIVKEWTISDEPIRYKAYRYSYLTRRGIFIDDDYVIGTGSETIEECKHQLQLWGRLETRPKAAVAVQAVEIVEVETEFVEHKQAEDEGAGNEMEN